MRNTKERVIPRFHRPRTVVATLAGVTALLTGCSINSTESISTATPVETTLGPSADAAVTTASSFLDYEALPQREALIAMTLQRFGAVVLKESNTPHSAWGSFDAYCSTTATTTGSAGWVSRGYRPKPGEDCEVQHNPQYGGKDMEVDAGVKVGSDGRYSGQIIDAYVNDSSCNAMVVYLGDRVPEVMIYRNNQTESTDLARSLSQLKAIDNQAIACFNSTRP